ncbi:MAG TPA: glutamine amidotransferase, partial [Candidatus Saccharibacteria bacterium]|nr:glutamine amidotransferase [Candidatus Saccharibacteria bacterium]
LADNSTPMLMVCGLYQLFGKSFTMANGDTLEGIGLFDATTIAKKERLIGNIITNSQDFGDIIGYENHSGQTYLAEKVESLGIVRLGAGNNIEDGHEGARYKNVIGTYMHGSLLPKNPRIADFLIEQAAVNRYGSFTAGPIDDSFANAACEAASKRPR